MKAILVSWRTLHAFLLRDLLAQFGRHNIGFLWVVLEPMILCAGVAGFWYAIKPDFMHGVPVLMFVVTGYMPLTLFRHLTGPFARIFRRTTPLLVHRQLDLIDIFLSRAVLEIIGTTMAFMVVYGFLYFIGLADSIKNINLVVWGWMLMAFFSLGIGACLAALSELSEAVSHFIGPFQYLTVPLMPTFYMVDWIPQKAQDVIYYNPLTHPYEMIRAGFFGDAVVTYYDPKITIVWGIAFLALGLWSIESIRDRLHDA
jgi:capsular polysaccharide transport system permease protein